MCDPCISDDQYCTVPGCHYTYKAVSWPDAIGTAGGYVALVDSFFTMIIIITYLTCMGQPPAAVVSSPPLSRQLITLVCPRATSSPKNGILAHQVMDHHNCVIKWVCRHNFIAIFYFKFITILSVLNIIRIPPNFIYLILKSVPMGSVNFVHICIQHTIILK